MVRYLGRHTPGIDQRTGRKVKYSDLVEDGENRGLLVAREERDAEHPQKFARRVPLDRLNIRRPSPEPMIGSVTVIGNSGGSSDLWEGNQTALHLSLVMGEVVVTPTAGLAPVSTVAPVISGTARIGGILSTDDGQWDNTPLSYAYQWYADDIAIPSATSSSYLVDTVYVGAIIHVVVTATNNNGTASRQSEDTAPVEGGFAVTAGSIVLSGKSVLLRADRVLLVNPGAIVIEDPDMMAIPSLDADYAYVYNATRDRTLYEKSPDTATNPYSITKVMTAYVMATSGVSLSTTVQAVTGDLLSASYDQMGLANLDEISYRDLLYGMFVVSGGDAAQVIGRHVGDALTASGGRTRFITEMNTKAATLGMTNTLFANTWGYRDPVNHYTTARDLAVLATSAYADADIALAADETVYAASITGGRTTSIVMHSPNNLINDDSVVAVKFGTWIDTGIDDYSACLEWTAPNGDRIIIVTLNSSSAALRSSDVRTLITQLPADYPYLSSDTTPRTYGEVIQLDGDNLQLSGENLTLGT
jgi:D-alanyl-D-alanine carboxypeptidase (penicillin-binding protein 5/6)